MPKTAMHKPMGKPITPSPTARRADRLHVRGAGDGADRAGLVQSGRGAAGPGQPLAGCGRGRRRGHWRWRWWWGGRFRRRSTPQGNRGPAARWRAGGQNEEPAGPVLGRTACWRCPAKNRAVDTVLFHLPAAGQVPNRVVFGRRTAAGRGWPTALPRLTLWEDRPAESRVFRGRPESLPGCSGSCQAAGHRLSSMPQSSAHSIYRVRTRSVRATLSCAGTTQRSTGRYRRTGREPEPGRGRIPLASDRRADRGGGVGRERCRHLSWQRRPVGRAPHRAGGHPRRDLEINPSLVWKFYDIRTGQPGLGQAQPRPSRPGPHGAALEQRPLHPGHPEHQWLAPGGRQQARPGGPRFPGRVRCTGCGKITPRGHEPLADLPQCEECSALLRPDVGLVP